MGQFTYGKGGSSSSGGFRDTHLSEVVFRRAGLALLRVQRSAARRYLTSGIPARTKLARDLPGTVWDCQLRAAPLWGLGMQVQRQDRFPG